MSPRHASTRPGKNDCAATGGMENQSKEETKENVEMNAEHRKSNDSILSMQR